MRPRLTGDISSTQDLKAVILEIRAFAKWFNQQAIKQRVKAGEEIAQPQLSSAATELVQQGHEGTQVSSQGLDKLISELERTLQDARRIKITLAALPTLALKKELSGWCRQNLGEDVLVDFDMNSTMLGGMVVSFDSHTHDWSFRQRILANSAKFPEVLRNV